MRAFASFAKPVYRNAKSRPDSKTAHAHCSSGTVGSARRRRGQTTSRPSSSQNIQKPRSARLSQCAREDSNLHGPFSPQGPQPCASTNSATGAWAASISVGVRKLVVWEARSRALSCQRRPRLESVHGARYIDEHMFDVAGIRGPTEQGADGWI